MVALSKQLQIYTSLTLLPNLAPLSIQEARATWLLQPAPTAGLKNASPAQRLQARLCTHVTSVKSCPNSVKRIISFYPRAPQESDTCSRTQQTFNE